MEATMLMDKPLRTDSGIEHVRGLARELNLDPVHAFQTCVIALELFDQLRDLHGFARRERRVLEAGALLHDIGERRGVHQHHKHSRSMIMELTLPGFTATEKMITACLGRYHKRSVPRPQDQLYRDLDAYDRHVVEGLSGILRIADALDRSRMATTQHIEVTRTPGQVLITVYQRTPCQEDIWTGTRKRNLFEKVFNVQIRFATAKA